MTDMAILDDGYECDAADGEDHIALWWNDLLMWEKLSLATVFGVMMLFAAIGVFDIGVRYILDIWW